MGLKTNFECWAESAQNFNKWRVDLARLFGIDFRAMEGFGGAIKWADIPDRPINLLLNHSDCDGSIRWQDAGEIATELDIASGLALRMMPRDQVLYFVTACERWSKGLRRAALAQRDVVFN